MITDDNLQTDKERLMAEIRVLTEQIAQAMAQKLRLEGAILYIQDNEEKEVAE